MNSTQPIDPSTTVAELACTEAGASRVFHRHGLDFCCHGHTPLSAACAEAGLAVESVLEELERERAQTTDFERLDERATPELIDHILEQYHEAHRLEVPRLLEMAQKVERVHAAKDTCPHGLAEHLEQMSEELEQHMQKEEQVLFPMLRNGRGRMAQMPISVIEAEHRDHAKNLERLRELTTEYVAPPEACGTWQALYLGLEQLQRDLMDHIHLENNVLFPKAMAG